MPMFFPLGLQKGRAGGDTDLDAIIEIATSCRPVTIKRSSMFCFFKCMQFLWTAEKSFSCLEVIKILNSECSSCSYILNLRFI